MAISPAEAEQMVLYQIGALYGFCRGHGVEIEHVKPHGALYNQAAVDPVLARAIAKGVARFSRTIPLVALASSAAYREAAEEAGLRLVPEAFADRRYNPDGTLQNRAIAGSVLVDPDLAAQQVLRIVRDRSVVAHDGTVVALMAQSICFHGDTPGAPKIIAAVRRELEASGVVVSRIRDLPR
jgi:UPF0271 protein